MAQLRNDNIVSLIGVVTKDLPVLLVMELCEMGSLEKYLRSNLDLHPAARLQMACDVAYGLTAIHKLGLVHRDISARNVLLDSTFRCKVADLGFARSVSESEYYQTRKGRFAIRWIAPEALTSGKFSEKSDVWSFGVLMWEIWSCGAVPYSPWPNERVCTAVANGVTLSSPEECPPNVFEIMMRCWNRNASMRPAMSGLRKEFNVMLASAMAAMPDLVTPPSSLTSSASISEV